jgi:hypothetical protein
MKEKLEINITAFDNKLKRPCFRILLNQKIIDEQINYADSNYTGVFNITAKEGKNILSVEHFGKNSKDTLMHKGKIKADVAIRLDSIKFDNLSCHPVDLHNNYFYPSEWKYKVDSKIKNNLYFGFNGVYEYIFYTPVSAYLLRQYEKYKKEDFVIEQNQYVSEETFVEALKEHIRIERQQLL